MRLAIFALTAALTAGSAAAEGWTIKDLGSVPTEQGCVELGWDAFARYRRRHELNDLQKTEWVVYAFDMQGEHYDAIITCAYGPNDTTRATLAVYSKEDDGDRAWIADQVERYWDQLK